MPNLFLLEETSSDLILHNKYGYYSKAELTHQLQAGHLTVHELASIYQLKGYQMVSVLRLLGIKYRNNVNDTRVVDSTITSEMHQVLLGTLLGDAFMNHSKSYMLAHGLPQTEYLYHIAGILNPFVSKVGYRKVKTGEFLEFWTFRHNIFKPYFDRFYSKGKAKKCITLGSLHDLDPRGLAYWFMDDGKYQAYGSYLCVGNVSPEEGLVMVSFLKDRFGLEATFQSQNDAKGYYNIYIKAESRGKFYSLIEPYVLPSMRYKLLGNTPVKAKFNVDLIKRCHGQLCLSAGRGIKFSGNDDAQSYLSNLGPSFNSKFSFISAVKQAIINRSQISRTEFSS